MNAPKAREYFSAYRDGSLDKGLKQALERKFQEDGLLRAEYQACFEPNTRHSSAHSRNSKV